MFSFAHITHVQLSAVVMDIGTAIHVTVTKVELEVYVKVSLRLALVNNVAIHTFVS